MSRNATHEKRPPGVAEPFFFPNGDVSLFGVMHRPEPSRSRGAGFVLCYPSFEEKLWVHRVFVSLADELAARGYHVLRFDYMGHGDSDGDFEHVSITSQLGDVGCAAARLKEEIGPAGRIGLIGLRLGALLSAVHASDDPSVERLILWDPVTDGARYMQEVLLANLATQAVGQREIRSTREDLVAQMAAGKTVNIEGYELSHRFYEEASALQLPGSAAFANPCLIVQIGRGNQPPKANLVALRDAYPAAELVTCVEEPFWKEIKTFYPSAPRLFDATLTWLDTHAF